MRKFDEIDNGDWFPAKYDRRNDLSVVAQYQINDRVNIGKISFISISVFITEIMIIISKAKEVNIRCLVKKK